MDVEKEIQELKERLLVLENRILKLEGKPGKLKKPIAFSEFVRLKNPGDDVKRTLAIGYYLQRHKGYASFNIVDVRSGYNTIKVKPPANINDKINRNIRK